MKNKNIKNKPKNVVDSFSCTLDFQNFQGEDTWSPLIKGTHQINPQNLSSTTTASKGTKQPESPPPLKQSTRNLSLGYTEIEKRRKVLEQDLFCVIYNWVV